MLDLRRLRYFRAIAEHGSLSAAARALNIAQPALTHHIGEMERGLGAQLLERLPQGVRLTETGHLLLHHAGLILRQVDQAESELRESVLPAPISRVVSLAMIPTMAPLTSALIGMVERDLPNVSLHLIEARTAQSHEMIQSGAVDFAVNLVEVPRSTDEPLTWEPLFFVSARLQNDKRDHGPVRFRDLARHRLIVPAAPNPIRVLVERIASQVGIRLNIALEIDGLDSRKQAIIDGLGSTLMSWLGVKDECKAGLLMVRPIIEPSVMRPVMLEHRSGLDGTLTCAMRNILRRLIESTFAKPDGAY